MGEVKFKPENWSSISQLTEVWAIVENAEDQLTAAQAEIARLKEAYLVEKNETAAFKERWNKDGVIIDELKSDRQKLQSALDVAVDGLEKAFEHLNNRDFGIFVKNGKATHAVNLALDKIKQIRGDDV